MKAAIVSLLLLVVLRPEIQDRTDAGDDIAAILLRRHHACEVNNPNEICEIRLTITEANALRDRLRGQGHGPEAEAVQWYAECGQQFPRGDVGLSNLTVRRYLRLMAGSPEEPPQ